jgi:hypothetical protein
LKQISAVISIVFLISTSIISRTGYCFYVIEACAADTSTATNCCHEEESTQSANCCGNTDDIECEAENANRESSKTSGVEDSRPENDCNKTICYRLAPLLLADIPNRLVLLGSDHSMAGTAAFRPIITATLPANIPDAIPPWGIHPSIATTVLRI